MARFSSWCLPILLLVAQGCSASSARPSSYTYRANRGPSRDSKEATVAVQSAPAPPSDDAYAGADEESFGGESGGSTAPASPPPPPPPRTESPKLAENSPQKPSDRQPDARPEPPKDGKVADQQRSPILIYTASFQMAVFEVGTSLADVDRLAREVGGFVTKRTDRQIVIRVPASRFYETVGRLEKMGDVTQRDVVAQDVTEEYLDTEVRLRNARAMRDRLEQLLAKANTVQDSLMIERELNRVAAEIERMEGRLKYLRDRAAFSTITVTFDSRRVTTPPPSVRLPFPWLTSHNLARLLSL